MMFNNSGSSNEDISLTIFILYLIKCFITSELLVSIEIAISDTSRIDSTTGSSLFICSLLGTGSDPGFDDSAPISIISAPSRSYTSHVGEIFCGH